MTTKHWSVKNPDGSEVGPLPTSEVIRALLARSISGGAWVSPPGQAAWKPIATCPEFSPHCPRVLGSGDVEAGSRRARQAGIVMVVWALVCFGVVYWLRHH